MEEPTATPQHACEIPGSLCSVRVIWQKFLSLSAPALHPLSPRCHDVSISFVHCFELSLVDDEKKKKKKSSAGHLNVGTRVKGWSSTVSLALSKGKYTSSQTVRVRSDPNVLLLYIEVNVQAQGFMYGSTYHVHSYMGRQRESDRPSV